VLFKILLFVLHPLLFQARNKTRFIFRYPPLHFLPRYRAVLLIYRHELVDQPVHVLPVLLRYFDPRLIKELLHVPQIT